MLSVPPLVILQRPAAPPLNISVHIAMTSSSVCAAAGSSPVKIALNRLKALKASSPSRRDSGMKWSLSARQCMLKAPCNSDVREALNFASRVEMSAGANPRFGKQRSCRGCSRRLTTGSPAYNCFQVAGAYLVDCKDRHDSERRRAHRVALLHRVDGWVLNDVLPVEQVLCIQANRQLVASEPDVQIDDAIARLKDVWQAAAVEVPSRAPRVGKIRPREQGGAVVDPGVVVHARRDRV